MNCFQKSSIVVVMIALVGSSFIFITGCQTNEMASEPDPDDALIVGKKFFTAISEGKADLALEQIHPVEREEFKSMLENSLPPVPEDFEVELQKSSASEGTAQLQMVGGEFGLDMKYDKGRWWVTRGSQ